MKLIVVYHKLYTEVFTCKTAIPAQLVGAPTASNRGIYMDFFIQFRNAHIFTFEKERMYLVLIFFI